MIFIIVRVILRARAGEAPEEIFKQVFCTTRETIARVAKRRGTGECESESGRISCKIFRSFSLPFVLRTIVIKKTRLRSRRSFLLASFLLHHHHHHYHHLLFLTLSLLDVSVEVCDDRPPAYTFILQYYFSAILGI